MAEDGQPRVPRLALHDQGTHPLPSCIRLVVGRAHLVRILPGSQGPAAQVPVPCAQAHAAALHDCRFIVLGRLFPVRADGPFESCSAPDRAQPLALQIAPTAMLFIPCRGGVSHRPDEYASPGDIERGVRALALVLAELSGAQRSADAHARPQAAEA